MDQRKTNSPEPLDMTWEAALQYSWLAALYTTILLTVLLDSHAILARVVRRRHSVRRELLRGDLSSDDLEAPIAFIESLK